MQKRKFEGFSKTRWQYVTVKSLSAYDTQDKFEET